MKNKAKSIQQPGKNIDWTRFPGIRFSIDIKLSRLQSYKELKLHDKFHAMSFIVDKISTRYLVAV